MVWIGALAVMGLMEDFDGPIDPSVWAMEAPLRGASVNSPVADVSAGDGAAAVLVWPGPAPRKVDGPRYGTALESRERFGYGRYAARMRSAKVSGRAGVVSAFFTYFNDGSDGDGDGVADNVEIDVELLAAEPSMVYLTVWTDYEVLDGVEVFHHVGAKVDLATGRRWQTEPGFEGSYGHLVEIAPLGFSVPGFDASAQYVTWSFEWAPDGVIYWVDVGDGRGPRELWRLAGVPGGDIPSREAYIMTNLWHNAVAWDTGGNAPPPMRPVESRIDFIRFEPWMD